MPRPGGPASRTWSSASLRSAAARIEISSWAFSAALADELVEPPRAQARLALVALARVRGLDPLEVGAGRADHRRDTFRAWAIRASGVSPGAPSSRRSTSCGGEAEPDQAVAGERVRVVGCASCVITIGARRPSRAARRRSAPRCACRSPGRPAAAPVAGRDGGEQFARRAAGEHGERHLRADALDADQQQEQVPLLLGGEAVEQQRVVADDQVAEERRGLADARDVAERLGRHVEPVADAAGTRRRRDRRAASRPRR